MQKLREGIQEHAGRWQLAQATIQNSRAARVAYDMRAYNKVPWSRPKSNFQTSKGSEQAQGDIDKLVRLISLRSSGCIRLEAIAVRLEAIASTVGCICALGFDWYDWARLGRGNASRDWTSSMGCLAVHVKRLKHIFPRHRWYPLVVVLHIPFGVNVVQRCFPKDKKVGRMCVIMYCPIQPFATFVSFINSVFSCQQTLI